jgi:hypothetical protein
LGRGLATDLNKEKCGDGEVADGGHGLGACSGADLGSAFVGGDVPDPVDLVLYVPVAPGNLIERGLRAAIVELAMTVIVPFQMHWAAPERLSDAVESTGYYVVAELLANASKHASAHEARGAGRAAQRRLRQNGERRMDGRRSVV